MESFLVVLKIVLYVVHVLVCLVLILSILLQAGRSAGIGAGLGGSTQTLFGASGGQGFLAKFTTVSAVVFMLTSVGLAKLSTPMEKKFEDKVKKQQEELKKSKGVEVKPEEFTGQSVLPEAKKEGTPAPAPAPKIDITPIAAPPTGVVPVEAPPAAAPAATPAPPGPATAPAVTPAPPAATPTPKPASATAPAPAPAGQ